ncbi:MAG: carbon-nitrogen hydrolase family protein [Opitutaceae bacterium]
MTRLLRKKVCSSRAGPRSPRAEIEAALGEEEAELADGITIFLPGDQFLSVALEAGHRHPGGMIRLAPILALAAGILLAAFPCLSGQAAPATNLIPNAGLRSGPDGRPADWSTWTPRSILAPAMSVVNVGGKPALSLRAKRFADFGQWVTVAPGIRPGAYYRVQALSWSKNVVSKEFSVMALVTWTANEDGTKVLQSDYVDQRRLEEGGWVLNSRTIQAPVGARAACLRLGLHGTAGGSVLWRDIALTEVPPPPARIVRIVTTSIKPKYPSTVAVNMGLMARMLDVVGPLRPDIVLFSENLVDRFVRGSMESKVEPIPGPLTRMLAQKARRYHTYIITTLHERDRQDLYHNTAVLIDRSGRIAGLYRKVHLTLAEIDEGLTPGSTYPVFQTDFGKIGILTCYDNWFPADARILRLEGAEMIFWPLAGDGVPAHWRAVSVARAVDNGVYLISSATLTNNQSRITNPAGEVVATTAGDFSFALKDIDLNQRWRKRYMSVPSGTGESRSLLIKERRPDTYHVLVEGDPGVEPAEAVR